MIPRREGPWRPLSESIAACEAHRDFLYDDYLRAIVDGREPTADEAAEHERREREARKVARQRAKSAVQRAAHRIVRDEYQRWMSE
jgi:hypothetical protein